MRTAKIKQFIKDCKGYSYIYRRKRMLFNKRERWIDNYDIETCIKLSLIDAAKDDLLIEMFTNLSVAIDNMKKKGKSMPWSVFKILLVPIIKIGKKVKS